MNKSLNVIFSLFSAIFLLVFCMAAATDAAAQDGDARQRALDFEVPTYFPSDWEALEAGSAAAQDYDDLFKRTVPLYAQAREDEVMAAREELIATGFTRYMPQYLQKADEIALAALDQYEAEDYYGAKETAAKALTEYQTLMVGAKVFLIRQEIIDRGFFPYDSDNYDRADDAATEAMHEYEAGNTEAAVAKAEEAQLRYNLVLKNGWTAYAAERKPAAAQERELAINDKAPIASREIFRTAESSFNRAEESYNSENFQEAAVLYTEAEAFFHISRLDTEDRRLRALDAIKIAGEVLEESNDTAIQAERLIDGEQILNGNDFYLEGQRLVRLAQEIYDVGDYEASSGFAEEAIHYADMSDEFVADQLIAEAERLIELGYDNNNPAWARDYFDQAIEYYDYSVEAQGHEEWYVAIEASTNAIEILTAIKVLASLGLTPSGTLTSSSTTSSRTSSTTAARTTSMPGSSSSGTPSVYPSQYTVGTWHGERECFWNIAGYEWVYNDPNRWRTLYEANKSKLPDPNNPDIIEPGTVLDIPSIRGETRQGMYNESTWRSR
jgi:nucleoid-associated protein YgaU